MHVGSKKIEFMENPVPLTTDERINLVLLPGLNCDKSVFSDVIKHLDEAINPVPLDLPADDSIDRIVDRVFEKMPNNSWVLGHSFGGVITTAMASKYSSQLRGIILLATPTSVDSEADREKRISRAKKISANYVETIVSHNANVLSETSLTRKDILRKRKECVERYGYCRYLGHSQAVAGRASPDQLLRDIDCKVYLAGSQSDNVAPFKDIAEFGKKMQFDVTDLGASGHLQPLEIPEVLGNYINSKIVSC